MNIAFDYDNTISEDLEGWVDVMNLLSSRGHNVFIVTYRDERFDINDDLQFLYEEGFDIYYTRGVAKRWWMDQFAPEEHRVVHVWVDDRPEAILNNSSYNKGDLISWREENELAESA